MVSALQAQNGTTGQHGQHVLIRAVPKVPTLEVDNVATVIQEKVENSFLFLVKGQRYSDELHFEPFFGVKESIYQN